MQFVPVYLAEKGKISAVQAKYRRDGRFNEHKRQKVRYSHKREPGCKWRPVTAGFAEQNGRDAERTATLDD